MADQPETRIIARDNNGKTEISVYIPMNGREHRTGYTVPTSQAETKIKELKQTLEKARNHVTVKEM
jgi:hypothetical protein